MIASAAFAFSGGDRPWMSTADTPAQRAATLVQHMTLAEKIQLTHGSCGGYVGNVCGIGRLGVPAIKMNDGPQGFRDNAHPGSSTAWPCSLAIGATFDRSAAEAWGAAMGDEFFRKGANVQLGPGVCLARVPRNGRNFEYISGEDPHLGYEMVQPAVRGIQGARERQGRRVREREAREGHTRTTPFRHALACRGAVPLALIPPVVVWRLRMMSPCAIMLAGVVA